MEEKHSFNISVGMSKQAALHFPRKKDVFQTKSTIPLGKRFTHLSRKASVGFQPSIIAPPFSQPGAAIEVKSTPRRGHSLAHLPAHLRVTPAEADSSGSMINTTLGSHES
jgi:hypothetical protein